MVLYMEVQHPTQQTLSSFIAFVPEEGSLRVGRFANRDYVYGQFGYVRQVFSDYYFASSQKANERMPHILFARSGDNVEDVLDFTYEFGPLRPNGRDESLLRFAFAPEEAAPEEAAPENYFAFYVDNWAASRKRFADALQLASSDSVEQLWKLLPYRKPNMGPIKGGALYPYVDTGTPIEMLERLWMADGRMTKEEVRRTARRLGIFAREKSGPKYQLVFEAVSLMDAFWHMLFLDIIARRPMLRCANEKCGKPPFFPTRSDQIYCEPECARRAANLASYHKKGAARRRELRSMSRSTIT
jgi:hypothetical protein